MSEAKSSGESSASSGGFALFLMTGSVFNRMASRLKSDTDEKIWYVTHNYFLHQVGGVLSSPNFRQAHQFFCHLTVNNSNKIINIFFFSKKVHAAVPHYVPIDDSISLVALF